MNLDLSYSSETLKFDDFLPPVTLKFYGWPSKTIGHLFNTNSSFMHHFMAIGEFTLELVRKRSNWVKCDDFLPSVSLKFFGWPWKTIGHLPLATSSSVHHFIIISNSNWSYGPEMAKLAVDLSDLDLWPWPFAWTSLLSLVITPENSMMIRWWEHSQKGVTHGLTDGRTYGQTDGLNHS